MSSAFVPIEILVFNKPHRDAAGETVIPEPHKVTMRVRPGLVAGVNNLAEAPPNSGARSMVYFKAESGMKQEFSSETAGAIESKVSDALLYTLPEHAV